MIPVSPHSFHIPVMGLAFTVDSPVKVARYGISSVISIGEDRLIEMMRKHYYNVIGETYNAITKNDPEYRSKRICDYLNLINRIVHQQIEKVRSAAFEKGSEIVKYFEMLPESSRLKQLYTSMMHTLNPNEKASIQAFLRSQIVAGSIDVNIMTKLDRDDFDQRGLKTGKDSEAITALRGYADSDLTNSSIVFSAGMNPRLFSYMEQCTAFDADEKGRFNKKVIIKVSDYRSALIQGKFLAKKGIWVSEYRIESGLNCGGHAFATDGQLLGTILEEFKHRRNELYSACIDLYREALKAKNLSLPPDPAPVKFTVQGGVGSSQEHMFLLKEYDISSVGWGTPFLLVPEATTVDTETLEQLRAAQKQDVVLSRNSPLGVRFHYLKNTSAEKQKQEKIAAGKPGTFCTEKHLAFNTEFTEEPICTASVEYQRMKLAQLDSLNLDPAEYQRQANLVTEKDCLCVGLSNSASLLYNESFLNNRKEVNVCPGPNIAYFDKVVTLQTMVDHIYGRRNIISAKNRPHMFIKELELYVDHLIEMHQELHEGNNTARKKKDIESFKKNLFNGILYYRALQFMPSSFYEGLNEQESRALAVESLLEA